MTSLFKSLLLFSQVKNSNYSLTNDKSTAIHTGYCWQATLCSGKTKIVSVSNGGYGGPDRIDYHGSDKEEARKYLHKLFALPLVQENLRTRLIQFKELSLKYSQCTLEEFELQKAAILNEELKVDDEMVASFVEELQIIKKTIASLKRNTKGKLAWMTKGKEHDNSYVINSSTDTPENRKLALAKFPDISFFLNDHLNIL